MKKIFFLIVLLSFLTISFGVLAQETEFPSPGLTPDSPFYFLKTITEAIGTFFTFGDLKKAERHAALAAERLAEVQAIAEKGKPKLIEKTLARYENQLEKSVARIERAVSKRENTEKVMEIMTRAGQATSKHLEVLAEVYEKVPEQAKPAIEQAMKVSVKGHEKAVEVLKAQNALGEVPEEAPLPERISEEVKERIREGIVVGGPCSYDKFKGGCKITSIINESIIKFKFTPTELIDIEWAKESIDREVYARYLGWKCLEKHPITKEDLEKCGIKENTTLDCELEVITSGTCTPIIFKFHEPAIIGPEGEKLDCPYECCIDEQYKTKTCPAGYECQKNKCIEIVEEKKECLKEGETYMPGDDKQCCVGLEKMTVTYGDGTICTLPMGYVCTAFCGDGKCEGKYENACSCPEDCLNCDDNNNCTRDYFDHESHICINEAIVPCCGNNVCEGEETYLTCPSDCLETPQAVLEENIPELKDYPKLEQVFIDLYVPFKFITNVGFKYSECQSGYFTEEEIEFMKIFLEIYKENPKLKDYPKDALYHFASWSSGDTTYYDPNFFSNTLRKKALNLRGKDDLTTAENIYDFVNEYITGSERIYKYTSAHSLDEVETIWQYKTGECEEKAYLMTALLKSVGIPTRIVNSARPPHKWAEIYSNNQWIPIPSTGALDHDKDKKVDFQEDMVLDVAITYDLSKTRLLDCVPLVFMPRSFIGYKYTLKFTEALLKLARNNEFKNATLNYISRWRATRTWKEREELGRLALESSVASIFGEKKPIYTWIDLGTPFGFSDQDKSKLFPENEMVVIGLESHYKMENTSSFFRELMRLNTNKKINFIVIKEDLTEAVLFDSNDMAQLSKMSDDFKRGSYLDSLLNQFVEAIKKVEKGELSETNFLLPIVDYDVFISAIGPIKEEGYEYTPYLKANKEVKEVIFEFRTEYPQKAGFKYIKFVNEKGETILEPKSNGYYETCPSSLKIPFNQSLSLKKDGDYVIIQGRMWIEE